MGTSESKVMKLISLQRCQYQKNVLSFHISGVRVVSASSIDRPQLLSDVRSIIAEQLGTELEKVDPSSQFVDLGADSLDTVEIMMALEEKFDIQLDEKGAEKISTVQEAADLIADQLANETP